MSIDPEPVRLPQAAAVEVAGVDGEVTVLSDVPEALVVRLGQGNIELLDIFIPGQFSDIDQISELGQSAGITRALKSVSESLYGVCRWGP